jgi:dTMP kinase
MKKGLFITLEGVEGAGKSSAIAYLKELLEEEKVNFILTREPGGTEIAEEIREVLNKHHQEKIHSLTELLLVFAARTQHLKELIIPSLEKGAWVISDRFTDSTYAYQGAGRKLSEDKIKTLENWVQEGLKPDFTFLFDVDPEVGMKRVFNKFNHFDRWEVDFKLNLTRVRDGYLKLARNEPKRFIIIDANQNEEEVKKQLAKEVRAVIARSYVSEQ